jgi:hypothetical protein
MNNKLEFKNKFLKYKQKYINLKNNIEMKGGAPIPPPLPVSLSCNQNTGQCYHDSNGTLYPSIYNCNTHCQQRNVDLSVSQVQNIPNYNPIYNLSPDIYTPVYYDNSRPIRKVEYYDHKESEYDSDSDYEYVVTRKKKSKRRKTKSKRRKSSKRKSRK